MIIIVIIGDLTMFAESGCGRLTMFSTFCDFNRFAKYQPSFKEFHYESRS